MTNDQLRAGPGCGRGRVVGGGISPLVGSVLKVMSTVRKPENRPDPSSKAFTICDPVQLDRKSPSTVGVTCSRNYPEYLSDTKHLKTLTLDDLLPKWTII